MRKTGPSAPVAVLRSLCAARAFTVAVLAFLVAALGLSPGPALGQGAPSAVADQAARAPGPASPASQEEAGTRLLRQPTVSDQHIAFSYANDIWIVGQEGGDARRLTSFPGQETLSRFSPDGRWVAFSGQYEGNTDVYVVPAEGGEPRRLTWHPAPDFVRGWTADGTRIVFSSGRASAPVSYLRFWTVPLEGGFPETLEIPRGHTGDFSPDGRRFAYQPVTLSDAGWRNYRGGQIRPIWIFDLEDHAVTELPWERSVDTDPVWLGNTVYFLSDRDHTTNVYAYETETGELRQVTRHGWFDVKSLGAGGGVVVYEQAGWLHLYDPAADASRRLEIRVLGDFPWARPHWKEVADRLASPSLSPTGVRALFEARGEIFTVPAEKGDWRNLTRSPGVADRSPAWAPDGERIAWFSDRGGEYALVIGTQDGLDEPRRIPLEDPTFYYAPAWSPDSRRILFTDAGLNLWVVDVATGRRTLVDTDRFAHPLRTIDPVWSPDSRYIAYAKRLDNQFHAIVVHSLEDGTTRQLTDGLSAAISPAWDASGKYLWFLASTNYALNTGWLDMSSFDRPVRRGVYLTVLAADEPSPLLPESDEEKGEGEERDGAAAETGARAARGRAGARGAGARASQEKEEEKEEEKKKEPVRVRIDWEGIGQRILSIDVPSRDYTDLRAGEEGVVFYRENPPSENIFGGGPATLRRYSLKDRKAEELVSGVVAYALSHDGKKLLYGKEGDDWFVVDAKGKPEAGKGKLDTSGLRMRVDPRAEWRQIFREAWRIERDYFYVPTYHGADWEEVYERYAPWVEHVGHRADLTYVLDLLGAELSVGHSYTGGGDQPDVDGVPVGLLGADIAIDRGAYRIVRIYTGENWNPELRAPLSAPGIDVRQGDWILAVNGREIRPPANFYSAFEGTADRQTVLTVNDRPTAEGARTVTVVPLTSEMALRQRAWVEDNRRKVDEMSGGRLAYVYLPNTGGSGYTYFNRYYFSQQHKEGAVIDERFNGGGFAADYMVDIMARELKGFFNSPVEERRPFTVPGAGIWGPKVMIINEYAGSGGDLLPYMFRQMGIGPLVGTTTWGGLVGIWDTPQLVDGGFITAPRGGFYTLEGEWAVENEGVAPDIYLEQTPAEVIAGRDPQLERAVEEALRLLEERPVRLVPEPPSPVRVKRAAEGGGT